MKSFLAIGAVLIALLYGVELYNDISGKNIFPENYQAFFHVLCIAFWSSAATYWYTEKKKNDEQ
ncbi:MAG: hypothetical protein P8P30_01870 [Rickettsiales bacterium]|nr:hypothetical protein [Rickettsiales bacterium]